LRFIKTFKSHENEPYGILAVMSFGFIKDLSTKYTFGGVITMKSVTEDVVAKSTLKTWQGPSFAQKMDISGH
jgi:hypothetical protein